jgi:hypothetical protein|tara:strand:- start:589 stop:981 length:393 start_codon:yes stop_codon:yes gene_type:complete
MKDTIATSLGETQIPEKKWYSSSCGLKERNENIDPLLISINIIRKEIKILEKILSKQIQYKKEKHNYKEIWLGFDRYCENSKHPSYMTTTCNKERHYLTWPKHRNKNIKIFKNKLNKITKMLEVYLNQTQ